MATLMGVIGRFPLALAAGLGVNAIVAYDVASKMTWADAMGLVVLEGLLITVLVLTGLRTAIFHSVPAQLKIAIGVGFGLFLALIGFVDSGFVSRVPDAAGTTVPVGMGVNGAIVTWPGLVFALGLIATIILVARKVRGAILIGIVGTTILAIIVEAIVNAGPKGGPAGSPGGWSLNVPTWPQKAVGVPDLSLLGNFSILGGIETAGLAVALLFVFTLMLSDFFDTMGTMWWRSARRPAPRAS